MHLLVIEDERCETIVRSLRRLGTDYCYDGERRWRFWAWNDTIWYFLI